MKQGGWIMWFAVAAMAIVSALPGIPGAEAQTSSLYLKQPQSAPAQPVLVVNGQPRVNLLEPALARASYAAVPLPPPRRFALHDLITIVIRESAQTDFQQSLDTTKQSNFKGELKDFPNLNLRDLLNAQINPSDMSGGNPKLDLTYKHDFKGDGQYTRKDDVTGRITAQVVDVKPNGILVLQARKHLKSDEEQTDLVLTGMCRAQDVAVDNTVLSTQLYDLHMDRQHKGELHKTNEKGLLTRLFEFLFNF